MSSANDSDSAPSDRFPRPWSLGDRTDDGQAINDANGELVAIVWSAWDDDEELQKLIVDSVNAMAKLAEFFRDPDCKKGSKQ